MFFFYTNTVNKLKHCKINFGPQHPEARGFSQLVVKFKGESCHYIQGIELTHKRGRIANQTKVRVLSSFEKNNDSENFIKKFIRNSSQQQETVIFLHFILLTALIAVLFPYKYKAMFFALSTLIILGGLFIAGFLYFGYYLNVLALILILALANMKENYLIKTKEKPTKLAIFLNDFTVIDNHLKEKFPRFQFIRLHNMLLAIVLILGLRFNLSGGVWLINIELMTILQILLVVFFFNFMLVWVIQIIIIFFCKMLVAYKVASTCAKCAGVGGVTLTITMLMHHGVTTPFIDPFLPIEMISAYQIKTMGFAAQTGDEIALGKLYKFCLNKTPPIDDTGLIDVLKTRESLKEAGYSTALENVVRAKNDAVTAMTEPFRWPGFKN
jgi:hypothetical protein